jgi:carboxymethylenebutenolidase
VTTYSRRRVVQGAGAVGLALLAVMTLLTSVPASKAQAPAEEVAFPAGPFTLHGFLYKPDGPGPFPGVLWNHGSERRPGWLPEVGPLFTSAGYVFFIPHRRGQGRSPGPYILDELDRVGREQGPAARNQRLVTLLEQQVDDQLAGLAYLHGLPYIDRNRLAIAGCSFGGIQTVLAAERNPGIRAGINFAGAAQTWRQSPELRERLSNAVRQTTVPMLFIQAENDYDLTPTYSLAGELERLGRQPRTLMFPPFGQTAQDGHEFCVRGAATWGPEVLAFLADMMR